MTKPDPITLARTTPVTVKVPFETGKEPVKPGASPYVHPSAKVEGGKAKPKIEAGVKVRW